MRLASVVVRPAIEVVTFACARWDVHVDERPVAGAVMHEGSRWLWAQTPRIP